jgi:hypothetical protein
MDDLCNCEHSLYAALADIHALLRAEMTLWGDSDGQTVDKLFWSCVTIERLQRCENEGKYVDANKYQRRRAAFNAPTFNSHLWVGASLHGYNVMRMFRDRHACGGAWRARKAAFDTQCKAALALARRVYPEDASAPAHVCA